MIVDDDLNVVRSGGGVINPGCRIPPATSAVHGLTDRDVADALSADEYFWSEFGNSLKESEVCLIAHNAKFDAHFLRPHLAGEFHIMCTLKLARTLYPDLENHKARHDQVYVRSRRGRGQVPQCRWRHERAT